MPRLLNEAGGIAAQLGKHSPGDRLAFSGVWGPVRAALAAAISQSQPNILMLLPQAADADIVAGDAIAFGLTQSIGLPLSSGDGRGESIRDADYADRLQVLQRLRERETDDSDPILVTAYIGAAM